MVYKIVHFLVLTGPKGPIITSLEPVVCQQLSCGYRCFMGSHVNTEFIASLQCITFITIYCINALLAIESNAL